MRKEIEALAVAAETEGTPFDMERTCREVASRYDLSDIELDGDACVHVLRLPHLPHP